MAGMQRRHARWWARKRGPQQEEACRWRCGCGIERTCGGHLDGGSFHLGRQSGQFIAWRQPTRPTGPIWPTQPTWIRASHHGRHSRKGCTACFSGALQAFHEASPWRFHLHALLHTLSTRTPYSPLLVATRQSFYQVQLSLLGFSVSTSHFSYIFRTWKSIFVFFTLFVKGLIDISN